MTIHFPKINSLWLRGDKYGLLKIGEEDPTVPFSEGSSHLLGSGVEDFLLGLTSLAVGLTTLFSSDHP